MRFDTLVRKAAAAASGLLCKSERVLVVYDEGGATLYYESDDAEDGIGRSKSKAKSSPEGEQDGIRRCKLPRAP